MNSIDSYNANVNVVLYTVEDAGTSSCRHSGGCGCGCGCGCGLFPLLFGWFGGCWRDFGFQDWQLVRLLKVVHFV